MSVVLATAVTEDERVTQEPKRLLPGGFGTSSKFEVKPGALFDTMTRYWSVHLFYLAWACGDHLVALDADRYIAALEVISALQEIPYGETMSYATLAKKIGKPSAFRAVANANGANPLSIIIPCHRVIQKNGDLGGYNGGVLCKQWLLAKEQDFITYRKIL